MSNVLVNAFAGLRGVATAVKLKLFPPVIGPVMTTTVVSDKRRFLKIKLKHLAAEAKIIRHEEQRLRFSKRPEVQMEVFQMHQHRTHDVRNEARATGLAYGFIRGMKYRDIESRSTWEWIHFENEKETYELIQERTKWNDMRDRVVAMVNRYGSQRTDYAGIEAWLNAEGNREKPPRPPKKPYTGPKGPVAPEPYLAPNGAAGGGCGASDL